MQLQTTDNRPLVLDNPLIPYSQGRSKLAAFRTTPDVSDQFPIPTRSRIIRSQGPQSEDERDESSRPSPTRRNQSVPPLRTGRSCEIVIYPPSSFRRPLWRQKYHAGSSTRWLPSRPEGVRIRRRWWVIIRCRLTARSLTDSYILGGRWLATSSGFLFAPQNRGAIIWRPLVARSAWPCPQGCGPNREKALGDIQMVGGKNGPEKSN